MSTHNAAAKHTGGHGAQHSGDHGHIGLRTYLMVFGALMILMVATVGAYLVEENMPGMPGWLGITVAMAIAVVKTILIIYFFMHIKVSERISQLYALVGFVALLILFGITMADYLARDWPQNPATPFAGGNAGMILTYIQQLLR